MQHKKMRKEDYICAFLEIINACTILAWWWGNVRDELALFFFFFFLGLFLISWTWCECLVHQLAPALLRKQLLLMAKMMGQIIIANAFLGSLSCQAAGWVAAMQSTWILVSVTKEFCNGPFSL